jgi:hypothetical protein
VYLQTSDLNNVLCIAMRQERQQQVFMVRP